MPITSSGPLDISDIVGEYGGSAPHSLSEYYRGGGLTDQGAQNVATSGPINIGSFYGAQKVISGSQNFISIGSSSFIVPVHNVITFELWGGGGSGGGGYNFGDGDPGGSTTISQLSLTAGGGGAGRSRNNGAAGGSGGVASGGNDRNWNGEAGNKRFINTWAGGRDGRRLNLGFETNYSGDPFGTVDGGGGRGGYGNGEGGAGGGGAYVRSIYQAGTVSPGVSLSIFVGDGGVGRTDTSPGQGGAGARGRIFISWA